VITILISKKLKKETEPIPSIVAMVSVVEWIAILFQIYLTALFQQDKYLYICLFALFNLYMINIFNFCYVRNNVLSKTATKKDRLNQKQLKAIQT
jgi:hypothetical protein